MFLVYYAGICYRSTIARSCIEIVAHSRAGVLLGYSMRYLLCILSDKFSRVHVFDLLYSHKTASPPSKGKMPALPDVVSSYIALINSSSTFLVSPVPLDPGTE